MTTFHAIKFSSLDPDTLIQDPTPALALPQRVLLAWLTQLASRTTSAALKMAASNNAQFYDAVGTAAAILRGQAQLRSLSAAVYFLPRDYHVNGDVCAGPSDALEQARHFMVSNAVNSVYALSRAQAAPSASAISEILFCARHNITAELCGSAQISQHSSQLKDNFLAASAQIKELLIEQLELFQD